ncbi:MAG: thiolase family protein [Ruminococcaceae bacterium]|nr:thiolase family protein [Oscillospiraceae bacterium]
MSDIRDAVVVAYGRSAVAKSGKKGALRETNPVDYAGLVLRGVLDRVPQLKAEDIDDVIVGTARPEGVTGSNVARLIAARAGLPWTVPGQTVNRFCSSGLQTIATAANAIMAGQADVMVAGGVEDMTSQGMGPADPATLNQWLLDNQPDYYMPMGLTAEQVAERYNVTREQMDALAVESHKRAAAAQEAGAFDDEIIAVPGVDEEGQAITFNKDQGIRKGTSMESLAGLKTVFKEDGSVTAGTSSQTSEGTAFVVLMSADKAKELGIKPIAKFVGYAVGGVDPSIMGIGPIEAVPKVLKRAGLKLEDMDIIELNEAFASQAYVVMDTLKMDKAKVNPNGGAMALGHPLGATGAILTCKALNWLQKNGGKYGMVTMCIGGGMGAAGIFEMA